MVKKQLLHRIKVLRIEANNGRMVANNGLLFLPIDSSGAQRIFLTTSSET